MGFVFYSQNSRYIGVFAEAKLGKARLVQEFLAAGSTVSVFLIASQA
jgi:hypothetical protein